MTNIDETQLRVGWAKVGEKVISFQKIDGEPVFLTPGKKVKRYDVGEKEDYSEEWVYYEAFFQNRVVGYLIDKVYDAPWQVGGNSGSTRNWGGFEENLP